MQQTGNHIKLRKQHPLSIKAVINYCLIALLTFSFSLQQFTSFANACGLAKENRTGFHAQRLSATTQLSSRLPFDSVPSGQEMEMEVLEEDETKNTTDEYVAPKLHKYSTVEQFYISSVRSRFLQLATSIHKRATVPFFILHHSWKSYLS